MVEVLNSKTGVVLGVKPGQVNNSIKFKTIKIIK